MSKKNNPNPALSSSIRLWIDNKSNKENFTALYKSRLKNRKSNTLYSDCYIATLYARNKLGNFKSWCNEDTLRRFHNEHKNGSRLTENAAAILAELTYLRKAAKSDPEAKSHWEAITTRHEMQALDPLLNSIEAFAATCSTGDFTKPFPVHPRPGGMPSKPLEYITQNPSVCTCVSSADVTRLRSVLFAPEDTQSGTLERFAAFLGYRLTPDRFGRGPKDYRVARSVFLLEDTGSIILFHNVLWSAPPGRAKTPKWITGTVYAAEQNINMLGVLSQGGVKAISVTCDFNRASEQRRDESLFQGTLHTKHREAPWFARFLFLRCIDPGDVAAIKEVLPVNPGRGKGVPNKIVRDLAIEIPLPDAINDIGQRIEALAEQGYFVLADIDHTKLFEFLTFCEDSSSATARDPDRDSPTIIGISGHYVVSA